MSPGTSKQTCLFQSKIAYVRLSRFPVILTDRQITAFEVTNHTWVRLGSQETRIFCGESWPAQRQGPAPNY
jgi:hypothetical protein